MWKKYDGGGEGELSPTVCFSKEVNQWLIDGDRMGSYLVADGYQSGGIADASVAAATNEAAAIGAGATSPHGW